MKTRAEFLACLDLEIFYQCMYFMFLLNVICHDYQVLNFYISFMSMKCFFQIQNNFEIAA